jgi:hypothetical protein
MWEERGKPSTVPGRGLRLAVGAVVTDDRRPLMRDDSRAARRTPRHDSRRPDASRPTHRAPSATVRIWTNRGRCWPTCSRNQPARPTRSTVPGQPSRARPHRTHEQKRAPPLTNRPDVPILAPVGHDDHCARTGDGLAQFWVEHVCVDEDAVEEDNERRTLGPGRGADVQQRLEPGRRRPATARAGPPGRRSRNGCPARPPRTRSDPSTRRPVSAARARDGDDRSGRPPVGCRRVDDTRFLR